MTFCGLWRILPLLTIVSITWCATMTSYRAAVYEYHPHAQPDPGVKLSRGEALEVMLKNVHEYDAQARISYRNDTDIIVFPENGLYGFDVTRETLKPYLVVVPDPEWEIQRWSPCIEPGRYADSGDTEVLRRLSCIAWDYQMYVVVNLASKESCVQYTDPYCPVDGQYQYNTNVVFDGNGSIVARYRKYYLYWQPMFDRPPRQEITTFRTHFGTFGTFTSGDIFYRRPAIDLVSKCRVTSIVAPMTWDNTFPFPLAIEVQQGFAINMGVNLLVANTLDPSYKIGGSGIYSSNGAVAYSYNRHSFAGKLIMADLPIEPEKLPEIPQKKFRRKVAEEKTIIMRVVAGNEMKFSPLTNMQDVMKVCHNGFCCNIQYKVDRTKGIEDMFVLGVFNGRHTTLIDLEIQVCGLIKCAGRGARSCGRRTFTSHTTFSEFILWGNFEDPKSVFPFVLLNGMNLGQGAFNYSRGMVYSKYGFKRPIIDVVLFGRNFARDPTLVPKPVNRTTTTTTIKSTRRPTPTTTKKRPTTTKSQPKPDHNGSGSLAFVTWTAEFILSLTGLNVYLQMDNRKR